MYLIDEKCVLKYIVQSFSNAEISYFLWMFETSNSLAVG